MASNSTSPPETSPSPDPPPSDTNPPAPNPPSTSNTPTPTPTPTTPTLQPPSTTSTPPSTPTTPTSKPDPTPSTSSTPQPPEPTPDPPSSNPPHNGPDTSTEIITRTITTRPTDGAVPDPGQTPSTSSTSGVPGLGAGSDGDRGPSSEGLSNNGKIAIAVVVPIVAVALLVVAGIFLWRKRKQRKDAEEQRRKEVEDYGYNPNADPTIPAVAAAGYDGRDDESSGYRGWGSTTIAGSTARKTSTTMSGGAPYSDAASPARGTISDTRSGEPLMQEVPPSPEGEILGVMGPSAANNRVDVHRGPSNASSSYSAAARSDGSGDGPIGMAYGGSNQYYDQYGSGNPYSEQAPNQQGGSSPIIRDVTARRNTRIENPAHYPQQTAGISQNF